MAGLLSARFIQALGLSAKLFADKTRKNGEDPYVAHLYGVCFLVQHFSDDEDVLVAALLHDVLEDISPDVYGPKKLQAEFGPRVLELVKLVSHDTTNKTWRDARQTYLNQLANGLIEACLISAADMLYNLKDFIANYVHSPDQAASYIRGDKINDRLWFYEERLKILARRLGKNHPLIQWSNSCLLVFKKLSLNKIVTEQEVARVLS